MTTWYLVKCSWGGNNGMSGLKGYFYRLKLFLGYIDLFGSFRIILYLVPWDPQFMISWS